MAENALNFVQNYFGTGRLIVIDVPAFIFELILIVPFKCFILDLIWVRPKPSLEFSFEELKPFPSSSMVMSNLFAISSNVMNAFEALLCFMMLLNNSVIMK